MKRNATLGNERGLALVITLLVVALLTVIVTEFTFSAHIDQRMARNALYSLQATLLARSGINMGEAMLLADEERNYDAYIEEWGMLGRSDELDTQLLVPDNMRLKVRVEDEMGKLNINLTRPRVQDCRIPDPQPNLDYKMWLTALGRLDPEVATIVEAHWDRLCELVNQQPQQPGPGAGRTVTPTPGPAASPSPDQTPSSEQDWNALTRYDFPTLDDAAAQMGVPNGHVRRLRPYVTALPTRGMVGQKAGVNVNTASERVLNAICYDGEGGSARDIMARRQEQPFTQGELGSACSAPPAQQGEPMTQPSRMFVHMSSFFNVRASAIVNCNPTTGRGGIRRSASMLVQRINAPAAAGASTGRNRGPAVRWTLTQLDWQKEGGAALFTERSEDDFGTEGSPESDLAPLGG